MAGTGLQNGSLTLVTTPTPYSSEYEVYVHTHHHTSASNAYSESKSVSKHQASVILPCLTPETLISCYCIRTLRCVVLSHSEAVRSNLLVGSNPMHEMKPHFPLLALLARHLRVYI